MGKRLASAVVALLTSALAASATTYPFVTLDGGYAVTYAANQVLSGSKDYNEGPAPSISYDLNHSNFSEKLNENVAKTTNFFTATPTGSCGSSSHCVNNTAMGILTVVFDNLTLTETTASGAGHTLTFTLVPGGDLTETGTYQAKYAGSVLACAASDSASTHGQSDCINWNKSNNDPITLVFQNVQTNGNTTTTTDQIVSLTLVDAIDWAITPPITFDWTDTTITITHQSVPTPLPGALPLFAAGLGAMGLLGWRRKRKAATAP